MPQNRRHVHAVLAFAIAMGAPLAASAQQGEAPPPDESGNRADHRALSDAVRRAERATNGQVLSAERVQFDGRDLSRVKVIDDRGRVRVYWDDPQSRRDARRAEREMERDRRGARRERVDVPARARAPRQVDPPRTRGHDGRAFNL